MSIKFNFSDFERVAQRLNAFADQIPFALAQSLNDGAEAARKEIIEKTWPKHVTVRDPRFMSATLTTKGERATKRRLHVTIKDKFDRASLSLHETGGTKKPKRTAIAVPSRDLKPKRTGRGVPKGLRPKNLANSFKKVGKFGTEVIYQRPKKGPLKLMYSLRASAPIKAQVPFHADFERVMRREVPKAFGIRIQAAMRTRRA